MTSPAGELSFQTRSQPLFRIKWLWSALWRSHPAPAEGTVLWAQLEELGGQQVCQADCRAGLDRRGLVARSLCFSNSRALEMQLHNTVMMGTWAQGYWCLCPSFLRLPCSGGNSQVQKALTWRLDGLDSASVLSCKAFGFSFLLCRSGEGKKSQFCYPTEMYWD